MQRTKWCGSRIRRQRKTASTLARAVLQCVHDVVIKIRGRAVRLPGRKIVVQRRVKAIGNSFYPSAYRVEVRLRMRSIVSMR